MSSAVVHSDPPSSLHIRGLGVAALTIVAGVIAAAGAFLKPADFWPAYLVAFIFWTGVSLGCLGLGLLHRMPGGRWGWGLGAGREFHAIMTTIPLSMIAAVPLIFGAPSLYAWANESTLAGLNEHQQIYLAPRAVFLRTAGSLIVWSLLAFWLRSGYRRSVHDGLPHPSGRLAGLGLVIVWLTISTFSVDFLMSLTPAWASSMFGALHTMGFVMSGMAFAIILRCRSLRGRTLTKDEANVTQDLGTFMMAFNLMWAYFAFSEYLIIWSGDLPVEVVWFADRQAGGWLAGGIGLMLFHFAIPFAFLLSRDVKRNPRTLVWVAVLLLAAHAGHLVWTVFPVFPSLTLLSVVFLIASLAALGGVWTLIAAANWRRVPFVLPAEPDHEVIGDRHVPSSAMEAHR